MDISSSVKESMVERAKNMRDNAYSPYSNYSVGAVLAVAPNDDTVEFYTGCNIENCNFTNTTHAEQVAVASAVSDGYSGDEFVCIAISTEGEDGGAPCGLCQQTLAEFVDDDFELLLDTGEKYRSVTLGDAELFRIDLDS